MIQKLCLECDNSFQRKRGSFCSRSCSAKRNNRTRGRPKPVCECGAVVSRRGLRCLKCAAKPRQVVKLEDARSDKTRRRILIADRGAVCEQCKLTTWQEQPIPLEVSHENGDSEDNRDENLKLLCRNCHGLRADHKGKAIALKQGKRQISRRKRYAAGKTY